MKLISYTAIRSQLAVMVPGFSSLTESQRVNIAQRFGFEDDKSFKPLSVDGAEGPKTRNGVYVEPASIKTPIGRVGLMEIFKMSQEIGGSNMGPFVRTYFRLKSDPKKNAGAFCAGGASYCLDQAYPEDDTPYLVGAKRLGRAVAKVGKLIKSVNDVKPDDFLIWDRQTDTPGTGHIGFAVLISDTHIFTIEFNVGRFPAPTRVFAVSKDSPGRGEGNAWEFAARYKELEPI